VISSCCVGPTCAAATREATYKVKGTTFAVRGVMLTNHKVARPLCLLVIGASACTSFSELEQAAIVPGAIFTTTADGSRVDANIYTAKEDVYLDGGPGPGAPPGAAGLPEGDYFFQVTSPSGQTLLSSDDVLCRRFHVNADGVVDAIYEGPNGCQHLAGVDQDHPELGAITVQLFPYDDTPNPGGEYKVWITPIGEYDESSSQFFGFSPSASKTDNYKVIPSAPPPPTPYCGDGTLDSNEQCDDGNTADGDGCSANCTTEPPPPPPPCCGDGTVDAGEECDDGNTTSGDGCSATCTTEHIPCCGDGTLDAGEQCDDGNTTDGDGCSATCTTEEVVCT
jgi:cysteine-rich repeat protein